MRIAFSSCQDVVNDDRQKAWDTLVNLPTDKRPDHVVLLGDNIYMDYMFGDHHPLGSPRDMSLADFSKLMHSRYAKQWAVPSFQKAVKQYRVSAIWDDHDFAWNNACGDGMKGSEDSVPAEYRRLSKLLFEQYRQALASPPPQYPQNPYPTGVVPQQAYKGGIATHLDLRGDVRLHLLDGRSFRQPKGKGSEMLGQTQRNDLEKNLLSNPGINLLASGTTLDDWSKYVDLAWLMGLARNHRIVVLSGDVHEPLFQNKRPPIIELTASALAQPLGPFWIWPGAWLLGKRTEVFGILEISADRSMRVEFWRKGKVRDQHQF